MRLKQWRSPMLRVSRHRAIIKRLVHCFWYQYTTLYTGQKQSARMWITRDKTGIYSRERPLEYLASHFPAFHDRATCFDNLTSAVTHLHRSGTTTHTARRCTASISRGRVTHSTFARYNRQIRQCLYLVIVQNYNSFHRLLIEEASLKRPWDRIVWEH
jgi:hypothetical protein